MSLTHLGTNGRTAVELQAKSRTPNTQYYARGEHVPVEGVVPLLGHATLETAGRYFRAGAAEQASVVERIFEA